MALTDCPKCWDTPCRCGHEYQSWSIKDLESQITMLQRVLEENKAKASSKSSDRDYFNIWTGPETEPRLHDIVQTVALAAGRRNFTRSGSLLDKLQEVEVLWCTKNGVKADDYVCAQRTVSDDAQVRHILVFRKEDAHLQNHIALLSYDLNTGAYEVSLSEHIKGTDLPMAIALKTSFKVIK